MRFLFFPFPRLYLYHSPQERLCGKRNVSPIKEIWGNFSWTEGVAVTYLVERHFNALLVTTKIKQIILVISRKEKVMTTLEWTEYLLRK